MQLQLEKIKQQKAADHGGGKKSSLKLPKLEREKGTTKENN
jgi:hypothetical protein